MKRFSSWPLGGCVVAILLVASAPYAAAETAEEVIEMSIKAQGGRDALLAVKSVKRTGEVFVDGQFGQMEGTAEEIAIPWKKAYQSMDLGVFQQESGFNGEVAWQSGMGGIQEIEGEQAAQIKRGIALNPFMGLLDAGAKAELLDNETIEDVEYFVVEMTPAEEGGTPVRIYVNKESGLIERTSLTTENPMFGEVEIVVETVDYAEFGKVKLPTFQHLAVGEVLEMDTEFTETLVDEEIDETIFDMPEDPSASGSESDSE